MAGENGRSRNGKERRSPDAKMPRGVWPLAPMGHDFPRRFLEITPDEILWDPDTILGSYGLKGRMRSTGQTVLRQPHVESTGYDAWELINDCPPPSQLPYIKRQIHLDPSRDAETIYLTCCADIPANQSIVVLAFETFNNLRTIIRWIDVQVFDALEPALLTAEIQVECSPIKYIAHPNVTCNVGSGCPTFTGGTVASPAAVDLRNLPKDFHNVLMEITDRHHVQVVINNDAPADRKVTVALWGWIESVTAWDNAVKR